MLAPRVVPLTVLVSVAMFGSAMLASWLGQSLNRENETVELSWTRPLPRVALALRYIAIDLCALAIAFAATLAGLVVLVNVTIHAGVVAESRVGVALLLGTAVVAMWYALTQALAMRAAAARSPGLADLVHPDRLAQAHGGLLHDIAVVLDVVNLFAYGPNRLQCSRRLAAAARVVARRVAARHHRGALRRSQAARSQSGSAGKSNDDLAWDALLGRDRRHPLARANRPRGRAGRRLCEGAKPGGMTAGTDDALIAFVRANRDRYLDELRMWVAIPSISNDPAHAADVRASAEAVVARMRKRRRLNGSAGARDRRTPGRVRFVARGRRVR